jgi:hypothetical protein
VANEGNCGPRGGMMVAMKRRWIIRSFFIGLLVLCVGGWVGSYWFGWGISSSAQEAWVIECESGRMYLAMWNSFGWPGSHPHDPGSVYFFIADSKYLGSVARRYHHFIGFQSINDLDGGRCIIIPLWFPTAISAALLLFVWRKARPKPKGRAFPVELKTKEGQP